MTNYFKPKFTETTPTFCSNMSHFCGLLLCTPIFNTTNWTNNSINLLLQVHATHTHC